MIISFDGKDTYFKDGIRFKEIFFQNEIEGKIL